MSAEFDDIQGLLRFGYKHHTEACFLLLRVKDPQAARAWLASAPVTSAVSVEPPPATALQLALSSEGLRALGLPEDIVNAFSPEFVSGLGQDASRARRLGDVGPNAPSQWDWGIGAYTPHLLLMLYALPGRLAAWQSAIEAQCEAGFTLLQRLDCSNMHGVEPFGFTDGISQPQLDWERERPARDAEQPRYSNLCCLGEFLQGYPNEYGGYTDRPLLPPERDTQALLPRAEDAPDQADLGRNGSYLVLRQLQQDVHGFWRTLNALAGGDAARREQIGAAMVGRTLQGVSLAATQNVPLMADGKPDLNDFSYAHDPQGSRCPLGAHVRRANPRTADLPPGRPGAISWLVRTLGFDADALGQDLVASTRFHRLLRRGREYGSSVTPAQAVAGPLAGDTGIHFICLGANIARQFEFVQSAWLASTHFDGLHNESDPLLGTRPPNADGSLADGFSMPQSQGPDHCIAGLPQFVRVRGGAYFFLPGLRALRYLVTAATEGDAR
ncbi:Dyp-type peroxidase [Rhodoferax sp.]|uniref:Dyp-type peroxidase n=1 Tax=Rhodoferax sp. TaxID=50421 RepID=UPI00374CC53E